MDVLHLVEQKNEVDAEGDAQRQHSHVVEIPGKIILQKTDMAVIRFTFDTPGRHLKMQC